MKKQQKETTHILRLFSEINKWIGIKIGERKEMKRELRVEKEGRGKSEGGKFVVGKEKVGRNGIEKEKEQGRMEKYLCIHVCTGVCMCITVHVCVFLRRKK